jgi:CheY-like chemotaxis protein
MNETTKSALVPKPPGALEKAAPGARRILSGMVADTLALAKKEQTTNQVLSVAMCGWAEPDFQQIIEMMLCQGLATHSRIEFKFFFWTTDFLEAARHSRFDIFILWLNPGSYSRKDTAGRPLGRETNWDDHGDEVNAYELIAGLKREFNRPVIAVSNCFKYDSKPELEKAGADAVFWMPFGCDTFLSALLRCLKDQHDIIGKPVELVAQASKTRPLKIFLVNDNPPVLQSVETMIRHWSEEAALLLFQDADEARQALSQSNPDLLIWVVSAPLLRGEETIQHLLSRKVTYPIIVMSAYDPDGLWVQEFAGRGLNVSFLPMPFTFDNLRKLLAAGLRTATGKP